LLKLRLEALPETRSRSRRPVGGGAEAEAEATQMQGHPRWSRQLAACDKYTGNWTTPADNRKSQRADTLTLPATLALALARGCSAIAAAPIATATD
jgi:hypothetical protein